MVKDTWVLLKGNNCRLWRNAFCVTQDMHQFFVVFFFKKKNLPQAETASLCVQRGTDQLVSVKVDLLWFSLFPVMRILSQQHAMIILNMEKSSNNEFRVHMISVSHQLRFHTALNSQIQIFMKSVRVDNRSLLRGILWSEIGGLLRETDLKEFSVSRGWGGFLF